jgi:hypothetical protein
VNKRIEELAEQCGFIHEHLTSSERTDALRKFELVTKFIVGKVVGQIQIHQQMNEISEEWVYTSLEETIKEHFGIGEEE